MAEKKFRSWVGFKEETVAAPTENAVERIRQLETQLADLKSRRDITSLSKEEFEILAGETAMSLIKTAQQRESRALAAAEQTVSETARITKERLDSSEARPKQFWLAPKLVVANILKPPNRMPLNFAKKQFVRLNIYCKRASVKHLHLLVLPNVRPSE